MASQTQSCGSLVYAIPTPSVSRGIALAVVAFFASCFLYFPIKLGPTQTLASMNDDPLLWVVLFAMFAPCSAFFLVLAFPPRSWGARIEIGQEFIRYIPIPVLRWIGEPPTDVPIDPQAQEILICRGSRDIYGGVLVTDQRAFALGFRLQVRSKGCRNRELTVRTGDRLTAHQAITLTEDIAAVTKLPVRLIKREVDSDGEMQELAWTPDACLAHLGGLLKLAFVAMPFVGGVVVGYLGARPFTVTSVGIGLWLVQTTAIFAYARFSHQKQSWTARLYWSTTLFTFAASYLMAFAIALHVFRPI